MTEIIDAAATKALLDSPPDGLVVLDVRTPEEFAGGRLPGAVMIDIYEADFAEKIGALDKHVPYLVYCKAGGRSAKAAELMEQVGFESVVDYGGGWMDWAETGFAIET